MPAITKSRREELQGALRGKMTEMDTITDAFKIEEKSGGGTGVVVSPEQRDAFRAALADANDIKSLLEMEDQADQIKTFAGAATATPFAATDAAEQEASNRTAERIVQVKSLGEQFIGSDVYREMKATGATQTRVPFMVNADVRTLSYKDVYGLSSGTVAGIPGLGSAQQVPLVPRQTRPTRVRDLFPSDTTTASVLYGIRETGFTNAARTVGQRSNNDGSYNPTGAVFGLKPKSDVTLVTVTYPIATVAHLLDVHKLVLDDEPRLRGLLDRDMIDGIKMQEDFQLLYGDGIGENITGILNTPGHQAYSQRTGTAPPGFAAEKGSAAIRRAATRATLSYFSPTGVVLHPLDWEDVELEEDSQGAFRVAVSVAVGAELRLWRLNVVDTPAITEGTFLVGAFGTGAKVYDREQVSVSASTENRDNYERNVVTLRAEERIALEVSRPEAFVRGTLTVPA
jgi:uncharacterized membrane protein